MAAPLRALSELSKYTPARPGDRTVFDSLAPFCKAMAGGDGIKAAVNAACDGAESTRTMKARLGRATYIPTEVEDSNGGVESKAVPDPGAWGIAAILNGLWRGLSEDKSQSY